MAYEIIGTVHKISATEPIQTKSGGTFQRRSITLIQQRYDQNTGEPFDPNFPTIDFTRDKCMELDRYKPGDRVRIRFDISGARYLDRKNNEEKYFNSLRGFRIEPYVHQGAPQPQNYAPTPQPQGYTQRPQDYPQSAQQQYQQPGYASNIKYDDPPF